MPRAGLAALAGVDPALSRTPLHWPTCTSPSTCPYRRHGSMLCSESGPTDHMQVPDTMSV